MTRVSILIPCYNAERWVAQAIQSGLDQTHADKEVIVVDDGSTDGSLGIIRSFGDRIRWETGPNRGGNVARNRLLELSTGEWLQYLDADDYLLPNKIEGQLQVSADADVVYSPTTWVYCEPDGTIEDSRVAAIPGPRDPWRELIAWELPQTGAALWRRSAVQAAGGWAPDQPCCQEHELYFRLLAAGHVFRYVECTGAMYRQWSEETVCRRRPAQVIAERMKIVDRCEQYLRGAEELTATRRTAIASARYECARNLYKHDIPAAERLAAKAAAEFPKYSLPKRDCFPVHYRVAFSVLGFSRTEAIAKFCRGWVR